jgi:hypothetical protein
MTAERRSRKTEEEIRSSQEDHFSDRSPKRTTGA